MAGVNVESRQQGKGKMLKVVVERRDFRKQAKAYHRQMEKLSMFCACSGDVLLRKKEDVEGRDAPLCGPPRQERVF